MRRLPDAILSSQVLMRLAIATILLASCGTFDSDSGGSLDEARRLEQSLPVLADGKVANIRVLPWCRNIKYARGAFSETQSPTTCNLFDEPVATFDRQAEADFGYFVGVLNSTGLTVSAVGIEYGANGSILSAWFEVGCSTCESASYLYEAAGASIEPEVAEAPGVVMKQLSDRWLWYEEH